MNIDLFRFRYGYPCQLQYSMPSIARAGRSACSVNHHSLLKISLEVQCWPRVCGAICFAMLLMLSAITACQAATTGIIRIKANGETTLYSPHRLSTSDEVYFQYTSKIDIPSCCHMRYGAAFTPVESDDAASDVLRGAPLFAYRLNQPLTADHSHALVAIAVIGDHLEVTQGKDDSLLVKSLNLQQTVQSCTSQEGLHVLERGQAQDTSYIVSDLYYALGYDIDQPSCAPATKK